MITLGMATIPSRLSSLERVLDSLTHQVDLMCVVFNGYDSIPPFVKKYNNIACRIEDNSMGDAMKFYFAEMANGYYLSVDDDLIYPQGYADYMVSGVDRYNGLVSLHGRKYLTPVTNFKRYAGIYRCLDTVTEDVKVSLVGSGCSAFHTDRIKISIADFKTPNKADIWLSKASTDQGVPLMVLAHDIGYLKYIAPPKGTTIWETTKDYTEHVAIMKTFIK